MPLNARIGQVLSKESSVVDLLSNRIYYSLTIIVELCSTIKRKGFKLHSNPASTEVVGNLRGDVITVTEAL